VAAASSGLFVRHDREAFGRAFLLAAKRHVVGGANGRMELDRNPEIRRAWTNGSAHDAPSKRSERSSAGAECVSEPIEM